MKKVEVIFLITGILLVAACSHLTIKLPTSDNTPPTLSWNVYNLDTHYGKDYLGSPTIKVKRGEKYRITLKALDSDGGVKSIILGGWTNYVCNCYCPENAESLTPENFQDQSLNFVPDVNDMVLTSFVIMQNLDFTMSCQDDSWRFNGGSGQLKGQVSNYYGGVTNELLKFDVSK